MRRLRKGLLILLIAAALTGFALGGLQLYRKHYVNLDGVSYPIDTQVLDLSGRPLGNPDALTRFPELRSVDLRRSGVSPETYDRLRELLPDCDLVWELPFQERFLPTNTHDLTVSHLTREEAALLDYLPRLTVVQAWDCRDYEALRFLQQRRPECKVLYYVELGGSLYDCDTQTLALTNITDPVELDRLTYLPRLRSVELSGRLADAAELLSLRQRLPGVTVDWTLTLDGKALPCSLTELDLSGRENLTAAFLGKTIRYFPQLTTLRLGATDLPEEALLALERGTPGLTVVWDMDLFSATISRDATEVDLSGIPIPDPAALEARLSRMPNLRRVILCDCGLSNPQMEELASRNPSVRFVWNIHIGGIELRTDAVYFSPNKYFIEITDADMAMLRYLPDLVSLDIGHQRGVTNCDWASFVPKLQYLVIADTGITDISPLAELQELVFLELFMSPIRDYRPLLSCRKLEDLNLGYTYGSHEPILEMTWLKRLWWPGNMKKLNWSVRNQLRQTLPNVKMNFTAGSSTGEGWRNGQRYYEMRDLMGMAYMTG